MKLSMTLLGLCVVAWSCPVTSFQLFPPRFSVTTSPSVLHPSSRRTNKRIFVLSVDDASDTHDFDFDLGDSQAGNDRTDDISALREEMKQAASTDAPSQDAAEQVERILLKMVDTWFSFPNLDDSVTADDFYTAITTWSDSGSPETARRVALLYLEQESLYEKGCESAKPNAEILSTVLSNMSSSRERGADRRVWAILERAPQYGIETTAEMHTSVIRSLARSKDRQSAERAEGVLKDAVRQFPPGIDKDGNPTGIGVDSFNVVLTAWAKSGREDGPKKAQELLVFMDQVHKENGEKDNLLKPNVSSFTSLIDAYAQTNEWDGVSESERMLNRLLDQYLDGDESLEPNVASWTIVISAWTRLARKNFKKCAERADRLLRRMEELHQEGRISVAPDAITYVTVMNAHAASKNAQQAQDILDEMLERYLDGEDEMKVTVLSVKVVIDAWIGSDEPDAMDSAERVLETYEDCLEEFNEPAEDDVVRDIYRSMLFGWTKHNDPHRAEDYLVQMVGLGLNPDSFCYDRVIESYTNLNAPDSLERTYAVFELMEKERKEGNVKPNERVFTSFIRALTKAKVKGLARKSNMILKKMNELYEDGNIGIRPTTFTLNAVLFACAESVDDTDADAMEAFKAAIGIFNDLRVSKDEKPDHVTFGNMVRCAALLPDGEQRDAVVKSTFQLCCERGFVNSYVIRDLQYACDGNEDLWRSLLHCPSGDVDFERLPAAWKSGFQRKAPKQFGERGQKRRPSRGRPTGGRPRY